MKKFISLLLVAVMTMAMSTCVFAEKVITTTISDGFAKIDGGNFSYDLVAAGVDYENITAVTITFTVSSQESGFGGGFIFNGDECGWDQAEWGNADAGKAISAVATGNENEFTITREIPAGTFNSAEGESGNWAQIVISSWWGADLEISKIEFAGAAAGDATPMVAVAMVAMVACAAFVVLNKKEA